MTQYMEFRALASDKDKESITNGTLIVGAVSVSRRTRPVHKGEKPRFYLNDKTSLNLVVAYVDTTMHPALAYLDATQEELRKLIKGGWEKLK